MNSFIQKTSKHCYYGNFTNILNYYGEDISEAEFVLLSNALDCELRLDATNLFLGLSNEFCEQGLERIGYQINYIDNDYCIYKSLLTNNTPILLIINSSVLTHNIIFRGTNRNHYIILLKDNIETIEISDSFVQTDPISYFHGNTDLKPIRDEIKDARALGLHLKRKEYSNEKQYSIRNMLFKYIKMNASLYDKSIINKLKALCSLALENIPVLLNNESLNNLSYNIKVAGIIARYEYLMELIGKYLIDFSIDSEILTILKSKWNLIAVKIMKCSMILNREYYIKIFEVEIPILIEKELCFYQELYKSIKEKGAV